ncbi:uncharacterized protein METZ01_LOCUS468946, partial [marine metagenome]
MIDAVHDAMPGEVVDREFSGSTIGQRQRAVLHIYDDRYAGVAEKKLVCIRVDNDRHETIFERVVAEDVGYFRADDCANTEIHQGPGRMFPRGTAT